MTRTTYRPLAVLGLVSAILAYVGCSSKTDTAPPATATPSSAKDGSAQAAAPADGKSTKLFADWPTPVGALLISGEQDGYLEPCGCTEGQQGGLRRRYDLVERMRAQQWPVIEIDLGSLIKNPAGARGGFEQSKVKFDVALKALQLLRYNALALSVEDLRIGVDEALAQFLNLGDMPTVLAANVTPDPAFAKTIQKSVRAKAGPVKVGITAVLDPGPWEALADPAKTLLPKVVAPGDVLGGVLGELEKDTDVQILMVQGTPEMAKALAAQFPGFDIVVETSQFDPGVEPERLNGGKTMLVNVGKKGKFVAVIGIFDDPKQKLRFARIELNHRYNGPAEPMRKLIEEDFQQMLRDKQVVETFPRHDYVDGTEGAKFAGAETCKSCHPNTYARWSGTKHARAFEDIVHDPHGKRSDHQFDAECVSCHTTGFEYNSGWVSAEKTPYLKGNQCENCHGPASKHAEDPDNASFRKAIVRTAAEFEKTRFCLRCHDEDNSPHFDFAKYWGQIAHKGMDEYKNPKVHRGVVEKTARQEKP